MSSKSVVLSRREMLSTTGKVALVAGVAGGAVTMEGCNPSQWIETALNDLPTILQIVTSILSIASAAGGSSPTILAEVTEYGSKAKTALETAQSVVNSYKTAAGSQKPGLLGQLDAALLAAQENLQGILSVFHVSDTVVQTTVAAAVGSAITVILAIQALVPPPPVASAKRARLAKSAQKDGNQVIKDAFNTIVGKAYPQAVVA